MARFVASAARLVPYLVLFFGVTSARAAYVFPGAEKYECSQPGMTCSISSSNCLDPAWVISHKYTPSGPDQLDLKISTRQDLDGNLLPVINASWTLKDDGSISHLNASELHVLVVETNQNICVRYTFGNTLEMLSTTRRKWMLTSDVVVVKPGHIYSVSVDNIPKPELDHSSSSISRKLSVPDCSNPEMRLTQPCRESGTQWSPDIRLSRSGGEVLTVDFSPDPLSERYDILCRCDTGMSPVTKTPATNGSRLSASFRLDQWVRTCCCFHIEIRPYFPGCGNDCPRRLSTLDFCKTSLLVLPPPTWNPLPVAVGVSSALLLSVAVVACIAITCRRKVSKAKNHEAEKASRQKPTLEHPTLLLIYSRDHPLFLDVVLKLATFLQGHCGILVLLDMLDSSAVSQVGLMRWLELQRNKLGPKDKIMVLCSRGVQTKWRAMCGQGEVTHQPDDLIGPFISLFLCDMHQPGSMGRYIAAYFDEISSEQDIPSFFDIAVKYKLMKDFEELYFRVRNIEKYEPRKVNHVEGIRPDSYFRCPSGSQLRNAIENFHTFQIDNPDWFEKGSMEDVDEQSLLIKYKQQDPQILERIPMVSEGPSIFTNDVLMNKNMDDFHIIAPEMKHNSLISENEPVLNSVASSQNQSVLELMPGLSCNLEIFQSNVILEIPMEDERAAGLSIGEYDKKVAGFSLRDSQPVKMEVVWETEQKSEDEIVGSDQAALAWPSLGQNVAEEAVIPWSKVDYSESDLGYSSKAWTEPDSDALKALLQLQQELMSNICN